MKIGSLTAVEVVVLLIISLNFRPGHKESLDRALQSEESAVRRFDDHLNGT